MSRRADLQQAWSAASALVLASVELRPDIAFTSARRLALAHKVAPHLDLDPTDEFTVRTTCLLADVGPVLFGDRNPVGAVEKLSRTLSRMDMMAPTAAAIAARYERVDGLGRPLALAQDQIPFAARLNSIFDGLVIGAKPGRINWNRRIENIKDRAGTVVDIQLADAVFQALRDPALRTFVEQARLQEALDLPLSMSHSSNVHDVSHVTSLLDDPNNVMRLSQGLLLFALGRTDATSAGLRHYLPEGASKPIARGGIETDMAWPDTVQDHHQQFPTEDYNLVGRDSTAVATFPVVVDNKVWGFVWATRNAQLPLSERDRVIFRTIAGGVADGVNRHAGDQHLHQLAHRDPLTGLANRWQLQDRLDALFSKEVVHRTDSALIMCDVDGLKTVNDTRGHAAGDELLLTVANILTEVVADLPDTTVCRLGGDEFCVLMEVGGLLRAEELAHLATERLGQLVAPGVGLSCGVAYGVHAETPPDLLAAADQAQYLVKRSRPRTRLDREAAGRRRRRDH